MKDWIYLLVICIGMLSCGGTNPPSEDTNTLPAFPGAQGGGMYATGGRGAMVYHVTSLEDNATVPGTLRYVLAIPGAKTVVFDVAGVIHLKRQLDITEGAITLAGQTAPGDGICIAGAPVVIKTSNVIIRFLRFRMGDENKIEGDALSCDGGRKNIIIDHCSFSWSTDECVSCYGNTNFTLQYCIISESLRNSVHSKNAHGYGGIWGGTEASFHHNLLAHHDSRNPRFDHDYVDSKCRGPIDFVNNVVYNWGSNSAYGGESVNTPRTINFENNYFKPGPATKSSVRSRLVDPWTKCDNCLSRYSGAVVPPQIYLAGNKMYDADDVTADNWKGASTGAGKASQHFAMQNEIEKETAYDAYQTVVAKAGCSLVRDNIDARIMTELTEGIYTYTGSNGSKNGIIDSQTDVGGWPVYEGTALKDTDRDGMPDDWETAHGLDPASYGDAAMYTLDKDYTNIEVYFNDLVKNLY